MFRRAIAAFVFLFVAGTAGGYAQTAPATIAGTVRTIAGEPVAAARITASGPQQRSTVTDAAGAFSLSVAPGLYRIEASKGGYIAATLTDFAALADSSSPLAITLTQPDLTSLRTIGRTVSAARGSGSTINTGAATSNYLSGAAFSNSANAQINNVLQHIPDVTVQHMSSQQDTTIILGGAQPYETQVLIDGHPLALGQYGVWASQYYPSFLTGGAETQSGPGNTTPFANIAVGGTVNLLSPAFTQKPSSEFTVGVDSYQTQYSNFLTTGSVGKFAYVAGAGVNGYNGPYYQTSRCIVTPDNGGASDNRPGNTGIIQVCGDASGSFYNKGEVLKFKYDFSPATSFEVGLVGAWGGYNPQGSAWGQSVGPVTIVPCLTANPQACTNPANVSLTGKTIDGYTWYTGSSLYNNQTLFDGQFRTAIGKNTLLIRPYLADIEPEVILGAGQTSYPASFSPVGAPSDPKSAFALSCTGGFGSTANPAGATVVVAGQTECFNGPYTTYEQDKLYGATVSLLHPFGDNLLNFTYDFHGQSTFAYIDTPAFVSVPFSTDRYSTFSLTGDLGLLRNVRLNVGLYDTMWKVIGVQRALPASLTDTSLTGLNRNISRFDPHFAATFRPAGDISYRAAFGSSATFPYVGQVSGLASYQTPAISLGPPFSGGGTLTEKNPALQPEVSVAYSAGVDKRFRNGSVLSADLQASVIHNVFETITSAQDLATNTPGCPNTVDPCEGIFFPTNVARLRTQLATLKYTYAPRAGLGYNIAASAERSILDGIPASAFTSSSASVPVNSVQICGNGFAAPGIATCVPYLKGYAQLTYALKDGTFAALGLDYQGKNNSYFQPPFALLDLTFRRPVNKTLEFQLSAENLLNTNNYGQYLAEPNLGTPLVAGQTNAAGTAVGQTSFVPARIPAPARQVRVQIRLHTGR